MTRLLSKANEPKPQILDDNLGADELLEDANALDPEEREEDVMFLTEDEDGSTFRHTP